VQFLRDLFRLKIYQKHPRDGLDALHFGDNGKCKWDSVAAVCPSSGTILHFLSLMGGEGIVDLKSEHAAANQRLDLIAIHGSSNSASCADAILESRQRLASEFQRRQLIPNNSIEARARGSFFHAMMNSVFDKTPSPSWVLPWSNYLPLLDLTPFNSSTYPNHATFISGEESYGKMRELAIPFWNSNPDSSNLQNILSKSSLLRPKGRPGLYQCPSPRYKGTSRNVTINSGLIFRPLPAASEDLRLSVPSLVFQCPELLEVEEKTKSLNGKTYKIGWKGGGQDGSLLITHPAIRGLDIRVFKGSGDWTPLHYFDEGIESLLAGSLDDLQSSHVIADGDKERKPDEMRNKGDCWVEFKSACKKRPSGFFRRSARDNVIAKPP